MGKNLGATIAGICLGAGLALASRIEPSRLVGALSVGRSLWRVHERGDAGWILLDGDLRRVGRENPVHSSAADPKAIGVPGAVGQPSLRGGREVVLIRGAGGQTQLVAQPKGQLVLWVRRADWVVSALGKVPGDVLALAQARGEGSLSGGWWVLLGLDDSLQEGRQLALCRVSRSAGSPRGAGELVIEWLRVLASGRLDAGRSGLQGRFFLVPMRARDEGRQDPNPLLGSGQGGIWVIDGDRGWARSLDAGGRLGVMIELPLAAPVGAAADSAGGLGLAFAGAVVRWDRAGRLLRSRGGFERLDALFSCQPSEP